MTYRTVPALTCDAAGCESEILIRNCRPQSTISTYRRHAARAGWRRLRKLDLCPRCAADERTRARIAALPKGLF